MSKIVDGLHDALKFTRLKVRADELLAKGDAAGGNRTAEGRRLLRECRRLRLEARKYAKVTKERTTNS